MKVKLRVKVNYEIKLNFEAKVVKTTPFTVDITATANAQATTDSEATARAGLIEGGVFISGTLAKVKTDPKVTVIMDASKKLLTLKVSWYAELLNSKFDWGFFFRGRKIRGQWGPRRSIDKWTVEWEYKKWKIYSKDFSFKYTPLT